MEGRVTRTLWILLAIILLPFAILAEPREFWRHVKEG
jgi:hypothetical protein